MRQIYHFERDVCMWVGRGNMPQKKKHTNVQCAVGGSKGGD